MCIRDRYKPVQSLEAFYNRSAFGKWKLIVEDSFQEDTGSINSFSIEMCLLGTPMPNSDEDSIVDDQDNCPNISNQDQLDSDGNGIGDICDIFSEQNILLSKSNSTCKFKNNGKNLDIKFSRKPILVLSDKFKQSLSNKINYYRNKNNTKLSRYLENANCEGLIVRPDRFILASIKNLKDIKLITKRNLKLLI